MTNPVDFYNTQAKKLLSNVPWVKKLQTTAADIATKIGFPTKHDDTWQYMAVDDFLKHNFAIDDNAQNIITTNSLPHGIIVMPIIEASLLHADKMQPYLCQIAKHEHCFQALNTAMLQQGLFIYIPENVQLSEPLVISHDAKNATQANYIRHLIVAESDSAVSIIEKYHGADDTLYYTNTITEIHVAKNANITHYKVQNEGNMAYHTGHTFVQQDGYSQFYSHVLSTGGLWVRNDLTITLTAAKAQSSLNGLYSLKNQQQMDHKTRVLHNAPDCSSTQDYKGIINGAAHAVFDGCIIVAQNAPRTIAKQQNKNLLLSAHAKVYTKPQLIIDTDDVTCTHGATVGQLDENALFYFATRGIDRLQASAFLIQAFAAAILQKMTLINTGDYL